MLDKNIFILLYENIFLILYKEIVRTKLFFNKADIKKSKSEYIDLGLLEQIESI